jgi:hypothetical protein
MRILTNKLLDEEAQERKKEQKMAQELKFGDKK